LPAAVWPRGSNCYYQRGRVLYPFQVFVMRAVLGGVLAVVIAKIFYPHTNLVKVIGLGVIIVGLAYFAEYLRKKQRK
jgi:hypothetical protein